mgnify:CR=1 FL=1
MGLLICSQLAIFFKFFLKFFFLNATYILVNLYTSNLCTSLHSLFSSENLQQHLEMRMQQLDLLIDQAENDEYDAFVREMDVLDEVRLLLQEHEFNNGLDCGKESVDCERLT